MISVKPKGNMAEATFTVTDEGLPIHKDATVALRPRLFLEGNFFLDVSAGKPERSGPVQRRDHPGHPDPRRRCRSIRS